MNKLQTWLRRDGWLLAVLALCVALCAVAGGSPQTAAASDAEARLARVLSSMEGAGRVEVALFYKDDGTEPCSAVIVADGADDIAVQLRLARAVTTLLHIQEADVEIFKRGGN